LFFRTPFDHYCYFFYITNFFYSNYDIFIFPNYPHFKGKKNSMKYITSSDVGNPVTSKAHSSPDVVAHKPIIITVPNQNSTITEIHYPANSFSLPNPNPSFSPQIPFPLGFLFHHRNNHAVATLPRQNPPPRTLQLQILQRLPTNRPFLRFHCHHRP